MEFIFASYYAYTIRLSKLYNDMGSSQEPPLDEIQWRSPPIAQSMGGIQTNTGEQL